MRMRNYFCDFYDLDECKNHCNKWGQFWPKWNRFFQLIMLFITVRNKMMTHYFKKGNA